MAQDFGHPLWHHYMLNQRVNPAPVHDDLCPEPNRKHDTLRDDPTHNVGSCTLLPGRHQYLDRDVQFAGENLEPVNDDRPLLQWYCCR